MSWGAVIGGGAALLGGAMSSKASKDSAKETNEANAAQAEAENEYNYLMWSEGRGSTGSAVLPTYGAYTPSTLDVFNKFPQLEQEYQKYVADITKANKNAAKKSSDKKLGLILSSAYGPLTKKFTKDKKIAIVDRNEWFEQYKTDNPQSALVKEVDTWTKENTTSTEKDLFNQLLDNYKTGYDIFGDPSEQATAAKADYDRLSSYLPMTEDTIRSVLDGTVAADRAKAQQEIETARAAGLDELASVREQRMAERSGVADNYAGEVMRRAQAQGEAIDLAENEAVNRLATGRERAGFGGTSTSYINGIARALLSSRDAAAGAIGDARVEGSRATGQARLDNAGDRIMTAQERATAGEQGALERSALIDKDLQTRVAFQDAPLTVLNNSIAMRRIPQDQLYANENNLFGALNFFRLGESRAPNAANQPDAVVAPGSGAAIGNTLAGIGGAVAADSIKNKENSWISGLFNKKKEG